MMKTRLEELGKLARAESGDGPTPEEEAKLLEDVKRILDLADKLVGPKGDIFDMQILIETAAEELREQIRENAEEES